MRNLILLIAVGAICMITAAQNEPVRIIVIGAHPDDCESRTGGVAAEWAEMGHLVKFVSVTNGDAGHQAKGGGALAKIRRAEAMEAGRVLGVEYEILDNHDGELLPTLEVRKDIIRLIREWKADVVISHRTNDYHPDHRYTGMLVQDAAYMVIVPNIVPDTPPLETNPVFLYMQDGFQKPNPFEPDIAVSIDRSFDKKIRSLAAHESQVFEWLPWTAGRLEEIPSDTETRLQYLSQRYEREITPEIRQVLVDWYGKEEGNKIDKAEAFEICEFGRHPDKDEILRLFPMLKDPGLSR
jgi:LmbE family N-acetylglucosaminyl deacetylase